MILQPVVGNNHTRVFQAAVSALGHGRFVPYLLVCIQCKCMQSVVVCIVSMIYVGGTNVVDGWVGGMVVGWPRQVG